MAGLPLCRICQLRPILVRRDGRHAVYCGGNHCASPERICKNCGGRYFVADGGTKYCSPDCRDQWHWARGEERRLAARAILAGSPCGCCGQLRRAKGPQSIWNLCGDCYRRIQPVAPSLRRHKVPVLMVYRLIRDDPTCWNPGCTADLLKGRQRLHVDHDHGCCPGPDSCGECVRGLLCHGCNSGLGHLADDAERIDGLASYIREAREILELKRELAAA